MLVLSVIFGIILILGGISCLFSPAETFIAAGFIITILMLVYGIIGVVRVITKKSGPLELIPSILAIIIGIIAILRPGTTLVMDALMAYLFAAWFVVQGVVSIYVSIKSRHENKGWILALILGIIGTLLGIISLIQPLISALAIGILISVYLIEAGLSMIVLATAVNQNRDDK